MRLSLAIAALTSTALLTSSCGKSGTFVVVYLQKGNLSQPVHQLDFTLKVGTQLMTTKMFTEPGNAEILFPTEASFRIANGDGFTTLTVSARNAAGDVIGTETGNNVVRRGKTTDFFITFGGVVLTDGGIDGPPAIDGGASLLTINKSERDFGTLVTGSSSAPGVFTITNTGTIPSGPLSLTLGGANSGEFSASGCEGIILSAGGICQVVTTFRPTITGALVATMNVSGSPGGMVSASLRGMGVAPGALTITPTGRNFGTATIGGASAIVTFEVLNTGLVQTGTLLTVLTGSDAAQFTITSDGCLNQQLASGGKCMLSIRFRPNAQGPMAASLAVNGTPGGTAVATLAGTGLPAGSLAISPPSLDFGAVLMGTDSSNAGVTVTNTGGTTLSGLEVQISGSHSGDFMIVNDTCTGANIGSGSTCVIDLKFHPAGGGPKVASVSITSPGGSGSAALTGLGITPAALAVMPTSHDFGPVTIGSTSTATFNVTNGGGTTSGTISRVVSGTDYTIMSSNCGSALGPGASCQITVRLEPLVSAGSRPGNLMVSASPGGSVVVPLSGSAQLPGGLSINPSSHNFNGVPQGGESPAVQFRVTNNGVVTTGALTLGISGSGTQQFQVVSGTDQCTGATLVMNATCTVSLKYAPIAPGSHSATFTVAGSPGGVTSASLSGNASEPAQLTIDPTSFNFADTPMGGMSTAHTFTVRNDGGQPATNVTAFVAGQDPGDFEITSNGCNNVTVNPGLQCAVSVRFRPTTSGFKSASVQASSTSGASAAASISGNAPAGPQLTIDPPSHDFGSIETLQSSTPMLFTVRNGGGGTTGLISVTVVGMNPSDFMKRNDFCTNQTLTAGAQCTVEIVFRPSVSGPRSASLQASSAQGGVAAASLSGNGFTGGSPALLTITPTSHNYGVVQVNSSDYQTFTIENTGGSTSSAITFFLMQGAPQSFFVDNFGFNDCISGQTLSPGASCNVLVRFSPPTSASFSGALRVMATMGGMPTAMLSGMGSTSGSVPMLVASFGSYDFGSWPMFSSTSTIWTITNMGSAASGFPMVSLTGDTFDFGYSNFCSGPIAAGDSCQIQIFFHPMSEGAKNATITLGATPGNMVSATLTGFGTLAEGGVDGGPRVIDGGGALPP